MHRKCPQLDCGGLTNFTVLEAARKRNPAWCNVCGWSGFQRDMSAPTVRDLILHFAGHFPDSSKGEDIYGRGSRRLSYAGIAKVTGVQRSTIGRWISPNPGQWPDYNMLITLQAIAGALGIPPEEMLDAVLPTIEAKEGDDDDRGQSASAQSTGG